MLADGCSGGTDELAQLAAEFARQYAAQQEKLDDEHREIEARRHRDPLIAVSLVQAATLIVASLPIVLLMLLLRAAREEPADAAIGELLIQDFASERPLLLPSPMNPSRVLGPPSARHR